MTSSQCFNPAHVWHVRFTPESRHEAGCTECPLSAKSGHWLAWATPMQLGTRSEALRCGLWVRLILARMQLRSAFARGDVKPAEEPKVTQAACFLSASTQREFLNVCETRRLIL